MTEQQDYNRLVELLIVLQENAREIQLRLGQEQFGMLVASLVPLDEAAKEALKPEQVVAVAHQALVLFRANTISGALVEDYLSPRPPRTLRSYLGVGDQDQLAEDEPLTAEDLHSTLVDLFEGYRSLNERPEQAQLEE